MRQRDIAEALGLSRGTVDRALHNRPGVSKATKRIVAAKARELGYSPNRIAQLLSTGRSVRIAMITPEDPLWEKVRRGARSFLSVLAGRVVDIRWFGTGVHNAPREEEILRRVLDDPADPIDGIGIAPADPKILSTTIDRAVRAGIPVVTLNTDSPESSRLCYVGQNPLLAGRIAGELMGKLLNGHGRVLAITAFTRVLVHKLRLAGFREELERSYSAVEIAGIAEDHDSSAEAYQIASDALREQDDIAGIFLTTGNGPAGVCRAVEEAGRSGALKIICFDFFPPTVALLKSGAISATIGQDPFSQGYQTMKILYDYIVEGKDPPADSVYTRTDIGLRANIELLVG